MYSWILRTFILYIALSEALFLFTDKPVFFCYKVCPLYCSSQKRYDYDASSFIYVDHNPYRSSHPYVIDDYEDHPPHFGHYVLCEKKTTTTTPEPTTTAKMIPPTTTEEPTWICMVCKSKCNYPKD